MQQLRMETNESINYQAHLDVFSTIRISVENKATVKLNFHFWLMEIGKANWNGVDGVTNLGPGKPKYCKLGDILQSQIFLTLSIFIACADDGFKYLKALKFSN